MRNKTRSVLLGVVTCLILVTLIWSEKDTAVQEYWKCFSLISKSDQKRKVRRPDLYSDFFPVRYSLESVVG